MCGSAACMPRASGWYDGIAALRVDPHDCEGLTGEPRHLAIDELGVAALPAVRGDHDHRPARQRAPPPLVVVGLERRADPRSTGPVLDPLGRAGERRVRIARAELRGHPGQPGPERERLDAPAGAPRRVQVEEERPRVRRHRARDVEDQDELARRLHAPAEGPLERLAAGRERCAHEPTDVERAAAGVRPQPARAPSRPRSGDRLDQLARALELLGGHAREVAVAQELVRRPPGRLEPVPGALGARAGRDPPVRPVAAERTPPASARPPPAGTRRGTPGRTSRGPRRARQASGGASSRRRPDGAGRSRRAHAARRRRAPARPRALPHAAPGRT